MDTKKSLARAYTCAAFIFVSLISVACNAPDPSTDSGATNGSSNSAGNSLVLVSGNSQSGNGGSLLAAPIVAKVLGPGGVPVAGASVFAQVKSGSGSIDVSTPISDANGLVTIHWTLGVQLGQVDLLNLTLYSNLFSSTATGLTVSASRLSGVVSAANSSIVGTNPVIADGVSITRVTITLLDGNHQAMTGVVPQFAADGINVYHACTPVNISGFSDCSMTSLVAGTKTLRITSPISISGNAVTFYPGPPKFFTVSGQIGDLLSVLLTDQYHNIISGQQIDWTITSPAGGSLGSGGSTTTSASGITSNLFSPSSSGLQTITAAVHGVSSISAITFKFDLGIWKFIAGATSSYLLGNNIDFSTSNVAELIPMSPPDNSSASLTSGTTSGVVFGTLADGTSTGFKLGANGSCDGSISNCSELDETWTPAYSNLVGYWKLNEAAGSSGVLDSSPKANSPGSVTGAVVFGGAGKVNTAATFSGSTQKLTIADSYLPLGNSARTISAWIKPTTTSAGSGTFIFAGYGTTTTSEAYGLALVNGYVGNFGWGNDFDLTTNAVPANVWSHVLATYNGTTASIYLNGVLIGQSAKAWNTVGSSMVIGSGPNSVGYAFPGSVDDVAVWNTVLTQAQIQTIYNSQSPAYAGVYASKIRDSFQTSGIWTSLSWVTTLPFMKELPDNGASESIANYTSLASSSLMTGNTLLWHFDEAAGASTIIDSSPSGLSKGTVPAGVTLGGAGKFKGAAYFNGANSEMDIADNAGIGLSNTDMTMSMWLKTTSGIQIWKNNHYTLQVTGGAMTYASSGNWCYQCTGYFGSNLMDGKWHQITIVHKNKVGYQFFEDGVSVGSYATTAPLADTGSALQMNINNGTNYLDEFGIWSRALSAPEIQQMYQRAVSRVKFQVQTCANANCSDGVWQGPDGTGNSFYSELNNVTSGKVNATPPSMNFAAVASPSPTPAPKRYFQYRAILESEVATTALMPEVKSITLAPGYVYDSTSPAIMGALGVAAGTLTKFTQTLGAKGCTNLTYNLGIGASAAGSTWYWWNPASSSWVAAGTTTATSNSATTINSNLSTFPSSAGNNVFFKAFLNSDGTKPCELSQLELDGQG